MRLVTRSGGMLLGVSLGLVTLCLSPATVQSRPIHFCFGEAATIVGTDGFDLLTGTEGPDVIVGLGGRDAIDGKGGDDRICLGAGGDYDDPEGAVGGAGKDFISGGAGAGRLFGNAGADRLVAGPGQDWLVGNNGDDTLVGGGKHDDLYGNQGDDSLKGGSGPDELTGDGGDDLLMGGRGTDAADYYFDPNAIVADLSRGRATGMGNDRLAGIEDIFGTDQSDILIGNAGENVFRGFFGDDVIRGRGGNDCLNPGSESNDIYGGKGTDFYSATPGYYGYCRQNPQEGELVSGNVFPGVTVDLAAGTATKDNESTSLHGIEGAFGTYTADKLIGDDGDNYLFGGPSNDTLQGLAGNDHLNGTGNYDTIDGGQGTDECLNGEAVVSCE